MLVLLYNARVQLTTNSKQIIKTLVPIVLRILTAAETTPSPIAAIYIVLYKYIEIYLHLFIILSRFENLKRWFFITTLTGAGIGTTLTLILAWVCESNWWCRSSWWILLLGLDGWAGFGLCGWSTGKDALPSSLA